MPPTIHVCLPLKIIEPSSKFYGICPKVDQVIYTLDTIYMPDIDPSSCCSPVNLFTRLLYYTKCQSRKREIIQPNIYRILPKYNKIICTLHTICMPNIMILAQGILQILCPQGPLWVKRLSLKRGII